MRAYLHVISVSLFLSESLCLLHPLLLELVLNLRLLAQSSILILLLLILEGFRSRIRNFFTRLVQHNIIRIGMLTNLSGEGPAALPTLLPPPTKTPLELVMMFLFFSPPSSEDEVFLLIQLVQAPIEKL